MMQEGIFDRFYLTYQPRLVAYAMRFVTQREEAQDIVQDSFLQFWKRYPVAAADEASRLLFTMVRNRCLNALKHRRLSGETLEQPVGEERLYQLCFTGQGADAPTLYQELEVQIAAVLDTLPPRCREVFVMSRLQGMKNREISALLGISDTAVEKHIRRALKAFSEALDENPSPGFRMWVLLFFLMGTG